MAPTLVNNSHAAGNNGATASVTIPSTTAGNLLVMTVSATNNPGDVTFTPPANWVQIGSTLHDDIFLAISAAQYYYPNNPGGITSVSTTISSSSSAWLIEVTEWSGVSTASPLDVSASQVQSASSTPTSGSVTPNVNGELVIGFYHDDVVRPAHTLTQASGFTNLNNFGDVNGFSQVITGYFIQSTAAATQYNPTSNVSTIDGVAGVATFKPVGATPRTVPTTIAVSALRTVPTSVALITPNLTRTVPSTISTAYTSNRTVPTTIAVVVIPSRTVPTTIALAGSTHTVPTSISLAYTSNRTVSTADATRGIRPMPLISQGVPAVASDESFYLGSLANDADEVTTYRSVRRPGYASDNTTPNGVPVTLSYDLSSIPAGHRKAVTIDLINGQGGQYYTLGSSAFAVNLFADYKLQGNAGAGGGAVPSGGWVDLVTVTGNLYPQRSHVVDLTGYNWVRFSCSASNGPGGNNDLALQMNVHDGSVKVESKVLLLGDSITAEVSGVHNIDGSAWNYGGSIGKQMSTRQSSLDWPVVINGGNAGQTMAWAATNVAGLFAVYDGKVVVLAFGTNDCNQNFAFTAGDSHVLAFYANLLTVIDYALNLGLTVVVPKIPWGSNNGGDLGINANLCNVYVAAHLPVDRPNVYIGPDFWTFFNSNPSLIRDGIHPTYLESGGARSGYESMIDMYTTWLLSNVWYGAARVVPASIALSGNRRIVLTTAALSGTLVRTVTTSIAVSALNIARTVPTSIAATLTGNPPGYALPGIVKMHDMALNTIITNAG